jgi:DNA-binding NarL/FixJ family response regulator
VAFPDGLAKDRDAIAASAGAGDVIWLSASMLGWETQIEWLAGRIAGAACVVVSLSPDDEEGVRTLAAGARGYCHALSIPALFVEIAEVVQRGGLWVGPSLLGRVVGAAGRRIVRKEQFAPIEILSAREHEVARAAVSGASNREIASSLGISERTVKAHLGAAFEKLGVSDRLQLVLYMTKRRAAEEIG